MHRLAVVAATMIAIIPATVVMVVDARPFGGRAKTTTTTHAPQPTGSLCNGLTEACNLRLTQATYVGAHNAGAKGLTCHTPNGTDICGLGVVLTDCAYDCQNQDIVNLLNMGVRWLDMAFVGGLGLGGFRTAHVNGGQFGEALGDTAANIFNKIGNWLAANPRDVVLINLKRGERDNSIKLPDGPGGYNAFYDVIRSSASGRYLLGARDPEPTLGQIIAADKRLVLLGYDNMPADVGTLSLTFADSWADGQKISDLQAEVTSTCASPVPAILQLILPFNGLCVRARAVFEVSPNYVGMVNGCAKQGGQVMVILRDYISASDPVFSLATSLTLATAARLTPNQH